jgi:hypothetical protein
VKLRLTLELVPTDVAVRAPADMDMDDGRPPWVRQERGWLVLNGADAFIVVVVVVSRKNQEEEHRVGDNLTCCLGFIYSTHVRIDAPRDKGPQYVALPFAAGISLARVPTVAPFKPFGRTTGSNCPHAHRPRKRTRVACVIKVMIS